MQTKKKLVAVLSIVSLLMSGAFVDLARAASLSNASDTLSTSNLNTSATHTITFTTGQTLAATEYFQVVLPAGFGNVVVGSITCPTDTVKTAEDIYTARCTASTTIATGVQVITIAGVTNPVAAGAKTITVGSYTAGGVVKENANVMVAIIGSVTMNATVPSTLSFSINSVATGTVINTATTTGSSTASVIGFGTLEVGTSSIMGQELAVTTNATYGYSVTVQQNNALANAAGATIDSFASGTPPANPIGWLSPEGTLGATSTYGHMGFTTDDANLSVRDFTGAKWFGFTAATPVEVMYHNGPADGSTQSAGKAKVAYRIQITALQEAGDYTNTLTYVATPSY